MNLTPSLPKNRSLAFSPVAILGSGILVTGIALVESWQAWIYAPFPLAHALLTLAIPAWFGGFAWKNPWQEMRARIHLVVLPLIVAVCFIAGYILLYAWLLKASGKTGDPGWDLFATYQMLGDLYIHRYHPTIVVLAGYLLLGVWPMWGEELFYRLYLYKGLSHSVSPWLAAILSSVLFGLRHSFQLAYLLPAYPLISGIAYFVWAAGLALLWAWLYERSQSIWLCIATHSVNLVLAPMIFFFLLR
jgi:membrane protease YdiL (CAAX protease family)